MGYQTPEQYLQYLLREKTAWDSLNDTWRTRYQVMQDATNAAAAYAAASAGEHFGAGSLADANKGVERYSQIVAGIPGMAITSAQFADSQAANNLVDAYQENLSEIPESVVTTAEFNWDDASVQIEAYKAALDAVPDTVGTTDIMRQTSSVHSLVSDSVTAEHEAWRKNLDSLPDKVTTTVDFDDEAAKAEKDGVWRPDLESLPDECTTKVIFDDDAAKAELDVWLGRLAAIPDTVTTTVILDQAGHAEDVTPQDLAAGEDELGRAAAATAADIDELSHAAGENAAAQAADTAATASAAEAQREEGVSALALAANLRERAAATTDASDASKLTWAALQLQRQAESATGSAAVSAASDTGKFTDAIAASVPQLGSFVRGLGSAGAGWALFRVALFGGIASASIWHILLDGIIETLAILIPAITVLAAGLGAFVLVGNLAQDTLGRISDRAKDLYTTVTATGQSVWPLTQSFNALGKVMRPEIWQLSGDALLFMGKGMGIVSQLATQTGTELDRLAARIVEWAQQSQGGLETFIKVGERDLAGLGQIFVNVGDALGRLIRVTEETHIAEYLLAFAVAVSKVLELVTQLPIPLLAVVIGLHGLYLWGGLATTGVLLMLDPLRVLALRLGGVTDEVSSLGQLGTSATGFDRLKAAFQDVGSGLASIPGRASGAESALQKVSDVTGQSIPQLALLRENAVKTGQGLSGMVDAETLANIDNLGTGLSQTGKNALLLAAASGASEEQMTALTARLGETTVAADAAAGATGGFEAIMGTITGVLASPITWIVAATAVFAFMAVKIIQAKDATQQWIDATNKAIDAASIYTVISKTMFALAANTVYLSEAQRTGKGNVEELAAAHADLSTKLDLESTRTATLARQYGLDMPAALDLLHAAGVKTTDLFDAQGKVWGADLIQVEALVKGYAAMGQGLTQLQGDISVQLVVNADQLASMTKLNTAWDQWITTVTGGESAFVSFQQNLATTDASARKTGASLDGLSANSLTLRSAYDALLPSAGSVLDQIRTQSAVLENGAEGSRLLIRATKDLAAEMIPLAGNSQNARSSLLALVQEADPQINTWQKLTKWVGKEGAAQGAADLNTEMSKLEKPLSNLQEDALKFTKTLQEDLDPAMARAKFDAVGGQGAFNDFADAVLHTGDNSKATHDSGVKLAEMLETIEGSAKLARPQFITFAESLGMSKVGAETLWTSVSKGIKPMTDLQNQMADANAQGNALAKSGFWGQLRDWFTVTLPKAFGQAEQSWMGFWDQLNRSVHIDTVFAGIGTVLVAVFQGAFAIISGLAKIAFDGMAAAAKIAFTLFAAFFTVLLDLLTGKWGKAWDEMQQAGLQVWHIIQDAGVQIWNIILQSGTALWQKLIDPMFGAFWNATGKPFANFMSATVSSLFDGVGKTWNTLWSLAWKAFGALISQPAAEFFQRWVPSAFGLVQKGWDLLWTNGWSIFKNVVVDTFTAFFGPGVAKLFSGTWDHFRTNIIDPMGGFFTRTLPQTIENAFKDSVNWVIRNVVNRVIGFINDVTGVVGVKIKTVSTLATGGNVGFADGGPAGFRSMPGRGSVSGAGWEDSEPVMLTPGEWVLREPARRAIDRKWGPDFLPTLNQADRYLGYAGGGEVSGGGSLPSIPAMYADGGGIGSMNTGYGGSVRAAGGEVDDSNQLLPCGHTVGDHRRMMAMQHASGGEILKYAEDFVGRVPYVWGGTTPSGWDCSGFTSYVYHHFGYNAPRTSEEQWGWVKRTKTPEIGGLAFFAGSDGSVGSPGHVGIIAGPDLMVDAYGTGYGTRFNTIEGSSGAVSGYGVPGSGSFLGGLIDFGKSAINVFGKLLGTLPGIGPVLQTALDLIGNTHKSFDWLWDHTVIPLLGANGLWGSEAATHVVPHLMDAGVFDLRETVDKLLSQAAAGATSGGPTSASAKQAESYASGQLGGYGWGANQMGPLISLWNQESGWNRFAQNPTSGAYGIPQALPYTKMPRAAWPASAGGQSSAGAQIDWGLGYIKSTYGTPSAAEAHEQAHGWYALGGPVSMFPMDKPDPNAGHPPVGLGYWPHWPVDKPSPGMYGGGPIGPAGYYTGGDVISAIKDATTNIHIREAMGLGSWLESRWNPSESGDSGSSFGAFQIHLPAHPGVTKAQAENPYWAAKFMEAAYAKGVTSAGFAKQPTDAEKAAALAERPAEDYYASQGAAAVNAGWQATLKALGIPITAPKGKPPVGIQTAQAWNAALAAMKTAYKDEKAAEDYLTGTKWARPAISASNWGKFHTDLRHLAVLQHDLDTAFTAVAGSTSPATLTAAHWDKLEGAATNVAGEGGPNYSKIFDKVPAVAPHLAAALKRSKAMLDAYTKARKAWEAQYGPAGATPGGGVPQAAGTYLGPGAGISLTGGPPITINIEGGPALSQYGILGNAVGVAAGGGSVGDTLAMFGMPGMAEGGMVAAGGVTAALARALGGASGGSSRAMSDAAVQSISRVGLQMGDITINNPVPERSAQSITHAVNRLAFLAGRSEA